MIISIDAELQNKIPETLGKGVHLKIIIEERSFFSSQFFMCFLLWISVIQ
jgi:hypothetical protein